MFYCKWFCCGTWSSDTDELPLYNRFPDDYCTAVVTGMSRPGGVTIHQLTYSCPVLVVYDWMLTLPREIELFWTGKTRSVSAALYFSTKYLNVLAQVLNMVAIWDISISDQVCFRFIEPLKRMPSSRCCIRRGALSGETMRLICILTWNLLQLYQGCRCGSDNFIFEYCPTGR